MVNTSPLTIAELVSIDTLHSEVIAGHRGSSRQVLWAHSCELVEPWRWIGQDELLMTVGFCVPQDTPGQIEFVRELHRAGVVGAMIGARNEDLTLSAEMLAEADRLGFPILHTATQVPWSAVARHVAAASSNNQTSQVMTLAKLYELTASSDQLSELAKSIATLLRIEFTVRENNTGIQVLQSRDEPQAPAEDPGERKAFGVRMGEPLLRPRSHQLSNRFPATLEIAEYPGSSLSAMVLVHLKRILEVETDRLLFEAQAVSAEHERFFDRLLREGESRELTEYFAATAPRGGYRLVAVPLDAVAALQKAAVIEKLAVVVYASNQSGLLLVSGSLLDAVRDLVGRFATHAGVSGAFGDIGDARGFIAEAESARVDAQASDRAWVEFAGARIAILSRSEREAREIIREVLGPLADDSDRTAVLRETLFTYLRHERSWAETSAELGIHRQTLSYRLRQVESLTGRSIAKTEDLAALWIASQAWLKYGPVTESQL